MKKLTTSTLIIFLYLNTITSQKIDFGIKGGGLFSNFNFQWTERLQDNSHSNYARPIYNIFCDAKVYKKFYIGTEIGVCSFKGVIDIKYTDLGGVRGSPTYNAQVSYHGWYQQEQIYFSVNPQFKLGKSNWLCIGGGLGMYNNFINRFHNGNYSSLLNSSTTSTFRNLEGHNLYLPNTVLGGYLNLTFDPRINEHLGWIIETRYIMNSPSNGQISKVKPSLSFNSFAFITGLSFHL